MQVEIYDKQTLKNKVVDLLSENGIDTSLLKMRYYKTYGGELCVYLGHVEFINKKVSFRKNGITERKGSAIISYGTKVIHSRTIPYSVVFNNDYFSEDGEFMLEDNIYQIKRYLKIEPNNH